MFDYVIDDQLVENKMLPYRDSFDTDVYDTVNYVHFSKFVMFVWSKWRPIGLAK